jgi:cytochrome bd-type quinol oxidase subunit 2
VDYPQVDVPFLGGGLLIAIVATLHVFVANFIVGGTVFLLVLERRGWESAARTYAKTLVVTMGVLGSVTGVGLWFSILGIAPRATMELVRLFFWPLLGEYVLFVVEIVAMAVVVYGWDRVRRGPWEVAAAAAAWGSMAVINGLLSFMLSSGRWPETRSLADAFFNPTYAPSLAHRALASLAVTGIAGLLFASFRPEGDERARLTRLSARWFLYPTLAQLGVGAWYLYSLRPEQRQWVMGYSITLSMIWAGAIALALLLCAYVGYQGLRLGRMGTGSAGLSAVMLLGVVGMMEATREAVRRPYLIDRYMFSNQILAEEVPRLNREGVLSRIGPYDPARRGELVFRLECRSCHTERGFVGIKYSVKGRTVEELDFFLEKQIDRWHPFMPVFVGTPEERRALAEYLAGMAAEEERR